MINISITEKKCCMKDCDKKGRICKGYCPMHYRRFRLYGDPNITKYQHNVDGKCSIKDCEKEYLALGLCDSHYGLLKRNGDPLKRLQGKYGEGFIDSKGYRRIKKNGSHNLMQHRIVWEEYNGRKLLPGENIHHKNGVRDDNRIENLELWNDTQPSGQRIADKVKYAKEILSQYENNENNENNEIYDVYGGV